MARVGQQENQAANTTIGGQAQQANNAAQSDVSQFNNNTASLQSGKMVGADPYLNPTYLAAVNRLRSGALNQQNNSADQQLRADQAKTGGMNSTATTGTIGKLAGDKMRLGNQLGAEQTAGDWQKNIGYQLNMAKQPLEAAQAQAPFYNTATNGQVGALGNLTRFGLQQYQTGINALQAGGGAVAGAMGA